MSINLQIQSKTYKNEANTKKITYLAEFLQDILENNTISDEHNIENFLKYKLKKEQEENKNEEGAILEQHYTDEEVSKAIEIAKIEFHNENCSVYEDNTERAYEFETTIKLLNYNLPSNIFRQSFICIFSIFESGVKEYCKSYFIHKGNSTEYIAFFCEDRNKQTKINLIETLGFSNGVKKVFSEITIADLMYNIGKAKGTFFTKDLYSKITEIRLRRNLHIHNNGIVDQKFWANNKSLGFSVGDTAYIDDEYLENTFKASMEFEKGLHELFPL